MCLYLIIKEMMKKCHDGLMVLCAFLYVTHSGRSSRSNPHDPQFGLNIHVQCFHVLGSLAMTPWQSALSDLSSFRCRLYMSTNVFFCRVVLVPLFPRLPRPPAPHPPLTLVPW